MMDRDRIDFSESDITTHFILVRDLRFVVQPLIKLVLITDPASSFTTTVIYISESRQRYGEELGKIME